MESGIPSSDREAIRPDCTTVCVLGLGYIGLPTASVLATKGFQVVGVEVVDSVVETINRGEIHIEEPDLDMLVRSAVNSGRLRATREPAPADVFLICVPTPFREDRTPDLTFVEQACDMIRPHVRQDCLIILESTSPPRTTENLVGQRAVPREFQVGKHVFVAHCPERVLPGRILLEVIQNDRVVGGVTPQCTARAKAFYESFVSGEVLPTSSICAEMTKLTENSFRDVNIAFANEIALVADQLRVDPWEVIRLANRHPRVNILSPGPGVGGHCISVDPWFLIHTAPDVTKLMRQAREINDSRPDYIVQRICKLAEQFAAPVIGCLGLAYKADVDDLRESPALRIVRELRSRNIGQVLTCDPYVSSERCQDIPLVPLERVVEESNVLALLTDHRQFRNIPANVLREKVVVDTRGMWR